MGTFSLKAKTGTTEDRRRKRGAGSQARLTLSGRSPHSAGSRPHFPRTSALRMRVQTAPPTPRLTRRSAYLPAVRMRPAAYRSAARRRRGPPGTRRAGSSRFPPPRRAEVKEGGLAPTGLLLRSGPGKKQASLALPQPRSPPRGTGTGPGLQTHPHPPQPQTGQLTHSKALQPDSNVEGLVFISKDSKTIFQFSIKTLDRVLFSRLAPKTATTKQHARAQATHCELDTSPHSRLTTTTHQQCTARWLVP